METTFQGLEPREWTRNGNYYNLMVYIGVTIDGIIWGFYRGHIGISIYVLRNNDM